MTASRSGNIWERRSGESGPAWGAFATYRDLGPERSITKVAQTLGKSSALLARWSSRWAWVLRSEAWGREVDRQQRLAQIHAMHEMRARHTAIAVDMLEKAREGLMSLKPADFSVSQVSRLVTDAVRIERLSRGLVEELEEEREPEQSVDEQRRRMRVLIEDPEACEALALISHKLCDDGGHGGVDAADDISDKGRPSNHLRQAQSQTPETPPK